MTTTSPADDPAVLHRLEAGCLRIEDPRRPAVMEPLVAGELDHAALGRERAAQDGQAAGRLERRSRSRGRPAGPRVSTASAAIFAIVRPSTFFSSPWSRSRLRSSRMTRRDAARVVQVRGVVPPARRQVRDDRRPRGDRVELVDRQRDARTRGRSPSRWSTPFVEPPVAATAAIAFSIAALVTIDDGRMSWRTRVIASSPAWRAAASLSGSSAGMPLRPGRRQARGTP